MQCPNCGRTDRITSKKFTEAAYEKVLHAGRAAQHAGYQTVAAASLVAAGGMKLWDRFAAGASRCNHCGTRFS